MGIMLPGLIKHTVWQRCLLSLCVFPLLQSCTNFDREYKLRSWERSRLQAETAYIKHDYKKSKRLSLQAVAQAEGLGDFNFRLVNSLCDLARACQMSGDAPGAEDAYLKALALLDSCKTTNSKNAQKELLGQDKAEILSRLADLYAMSGKFDLAAKYFKLALTIYREYCSPDAKEVKDNFVGQELVRAYAGLAQVDLELKNYPEAITCFERALSLAKVTAYPEILLEEIRLSYSELLKTLGRTKELHSLFTDKFWAQYTSEAFLSLAKQDTKEAESYFLQALAEAKKPNNKQERLMKSFYNLGNFYAGLGRFSDLEKICKEAMLEARKKQFFNRYDYDLDQLMTLYSTGYSIKGQPFLAVPVLQEQLKYRFNHYGPTSLELISSCSSLARAYLMNGEKVLASSLADKTMVLLIPKYENDKNALPAIAELGSVYESLAQYKQAELLYKKVCILNQKRQDPYDSRTIAGFISLCRLYLETNRKDLAQLKNQEIIQYLHKMSFPKQIEVSPYLVILANIYFSFSAYDLTLPIYQEIERIKVENNGSLPLNPKMLTELEHNMKKFQSRH